jgi:hypothetical protein
VFEAILPGGVSCPDRQMRPILTRAGGIENPRESLQNVAGLIDRDEGERR